MGKRLGSGGVIRTSALALLLLGLVAASTACGACEEAQEQERGIPGPSTAEPSTCDAPAYGHPHLRALYAVEVPGGDPAILSPSPDAVLSVVEALLSALELALTVDRDAVPPAAAVVVQGDAWGAATRLRRTLVSTSDSEALLQAFETLIAHLAIAADERPTGVEPPPVALQLLSAEQGWREFDTEHSTLMHERFFGNRRVFRIFVRGDHEARALVSQLVALDAMGGAYLSPVVGEVELLELDADGPTRARVMHLDRPRLGCGEVGLHEENEVRRIPDLGADTFLLNIEAPEPLSTLPCSRCHADNSAFSLPTEQTAPRDRLGQVLSRIEEERRSIPLVPGGPPSAQ